MRAWNDLVAEGRRAVKKQSEAKWKLGDLALEVAPMGRNGVNNGSTAKLDRYAVEIDVPVESLLTYRQVAYTWEPELRSSGEKASWSVHRVLIDLEPDDEERPGELRRLIADHGGHVTVDQVRRSFGKRPTRDPRRTDADKVEQLKNLLADPAVRAGVATDPTTRRNMSRAVDEHYTRQTSAAERRERERAGPLVETSEALRALGWLHQSRDRYRWALETLRGLPPLPEDLRTEFRNEIDLLETHLGWLREAVKARRSASLGDEIEEFLASQED